MFSTSWAVGHIGTNITVYPDEVCGGYVLRDCLTGKTLEIH